MANVYRLRFLKSYTLNDREIKRGEMVEVSELVAPDLVRQGIAVVSGCRSTGQNQAVLSPSEVRGSK